MLFRSEVLLLLGQVYLKQGDPKEARDAFRRLVIEHPDDYRVGQAKLFLDYIAGSFGDLPPPAPLPPRKGPGQGRAQVPDENDLLPPE